MYAGMAIIGPAVRRAAVTFFFLLIAGAGAAQAQLFDTRAPQAYMIDAETGTVLLSKDAQMKAPPASLAKLMTVEVVFHALDSGRLSLDDTFAVSEHAWRTGGAMSGGSTMFAELGSTIRVEDLLQGIIVQSANDGCIVIAEGMAGSEDNFAQLMTERARKIGLTDSVFKNATGLPAEGEHVTAHDLTMLALHIWREYPQYYHYFSEPQFKWNGIQQRNRNPLIGMDIGADGLKTGHTEDAGYGIVGSIERDGRRLFATLLGMGSEGERAEEARKVLDWGIHAFEKTPIFADGEVVGEASVYGGTKSSVALKAKGSVSIFVPVASRDRLVARIIYQGPVEAPVEEGARIGALKVWIGDTLSQETPLYAAESVDVGELHQRALDAVGELMIGWLR